METNLGTLLVTELGAAAIESAAAPNHLFWYASTLGLICLAAALWKALAIARMAMRIDLEGINL
jgi:hypothetical protein